PLRTLRLKELLRSFEQLHGRTFYECNGENGARGGQVACSTAESGIHSERHFRATMNYVLNNAVRPRYVVH
ncbi:MAG: hypothetical protein ACE5KM_21990, partial [Planctomycetaceae bacterium]